MGSRLEAAPIGRLCPARLHEVHSADGVVLRAREWGDPTAPGLLFVHGWSQSDLCWAKQVRGPLADRFRIVTFDLRGHGSSDKPTATEHYTESGRWADDLAAVLAQTGLEHPVLVAWSYGGLIVADYLASWGDREIAGINLVGATIVLSRTSPHVGEGLLANARDACAAELDANIPAMQRFVRACTARPLADHEFADALAWNMAVPPEIRAALFRREVDGREALAAVDVPVLVSHGAEDRIVLPTMAEEVVDIAGAAVASWYRGIGHMPFWEDPERFDRELAEFSDRARARLSPPT